MMRADGLHTVDEVASWQAATNITDAPHRAHIARAFRVRRQFDSLPAGAAFRLDRRGELHHVSSDLGRNRAGDAGVVNRSTGVAPRGLLDVGGNALLVC